MSWQDVVITIVNLVFSVSLIPQVIHGFKAKTGPIKFQTSVPTCIGLFIIAVTFVSLGLYFSAIVSALTGLIWLLFVWQRIIYKI